MENKNKTINIEEEEFFQYLKSAEGGDSDAQNNLGRCYSNGIGITKDEEKAFQWYLKSAEEGNLKGQFNIGNCNEHGIGTVKDEGKAFKWYLKSAKGGDSDAQFNIGRFYFNGIGITKDDEKAYYWYLKSAEGGNIKGQFNIGICNEHGIGTVRDEEKAFQWYMKSAEGGYLGGQYNLGCCYIKGTGTVKNEQKAFNWYLKSAEGGSHLGQYNTGYCYQNGIGTIKDETQAFQWYLKSAEGGNPMGQYNLGLCYQHGVGTIKDYAKAFEWCLKSAEEGDSYGQYNLGYCYEKGIGTIKDEEKAFQWYLKSAEVGDSDGQNSLGRCYRNGIGTTKDDEKAFQWLLKSAEGGNGEGQNNLGYFYHNGIGTTKDEGKAFQWFLKSAEGGNHGGQNNIGFCYRFGVGIKKDEGKAFQWYLKSAEGGAQFGQNAVEYCHRNEISYLKKKRNKLEHQCIKCENLNQLNNACSDCKLIERPKWTSGNYGVDKIIQMTQSDEDANEWEIWRWIDYSKLKNIEYLAEGGFGSIWKAEWIDMPEEVFEFYKSNQIALKKLKNSQEISSEFLKELTANFQCRDKYVLPILGITQDSMTKEYAIVLRYMKNGNLRDFLDQNKSLPWIERLWLLSSFISGLKVIHSKGFVHSDLHPGNLMITEAYSDSKYKFIRLGDLGLCKLANETSSSGKYGVLPYIAPEALDKYQYSQASDIYSVGIIMWIISTGKIPFANRAHDVELVFDIVNGLRPKINNNIPQCYIELMEKCWHKDPAERPNAEMIYIQSETWINELLYEVKTENSLMFLNANQKMQDEFKDEDLSSETTHSEAYITSNLLPTIPEYDTFLSRQQFFSIPDNIIVEDEESETQEMDSKFDSLGIN
ncbi:hypothetical protein Glove_301g66 [Diversispora epigaea]|uniref:Protein kinase domain-containing protein n=1 Tax=Diversispora epigaea TaxID=1348612 RepID=A0A397HVX5_9GLOM|nr:hypothetical protein Glove_301g66 [Diversispora epigaea]